MLGGIPKWAHTSILMVRYTCSCFLHLAQLTTLLLDGYILAGVQVAGLSSEFATWCGLSKDDPRYDEELMSFWYQMTPMQYALEIVEDNTCILEKLWRGRLRVRQETCPAQDSKQAKLQ